MSVLALLAWQLAGQPAHAQWVSNSRFELPNASAPVRSVELPWRDDGSDSQAGTGLMVAAGLLGGAVGFVGGAIVGARLGTCPSGCEDPGLTESFVGAMIGSGVGIPIGVHLANRGRGNLPGSVGVSVLIGGAGTLLAFATHSFVPVMLAPVAQIITSIGIERAPREPDE